MHLGKSCDAGGKLEFERLEINSRIRAALTATMQDLMNRPYWPKLSRLNLSGIFRLAGQYVSSLIGHHPIGYMS